MRIFFEDLYSKQQFQDTETNTHKRETEYVCDICLKGFRQKRDLKKHPQTHKKCTMRMK